MLQVYLQMTMRQLMVVVAVMVLMGMKMQSAVLALPSEAKFDADRIIKEAFSTKLVYERLAYMTDTFGPRFSGSNALETAIDWTKAQAERDGLKVYEEPVMIPNWIRGHEHAMLLSPRLKNVRMVGLGNSVGTPHGKPMVAKVIVVNSFEELDKLGRKVRGYIVVFNEEFVDYDVTVEYRVTAAVRAQQYGACAALVRSISPFGMYTVHAGTTSLSAHIPTAAITMEDSLMFERMQKRNQTIILELQMEAHFLPDRPSRNLIIEIEGSQKPREIVLLGGHMDSWDNADGAMDDGGGAFVSWEVIRVIKKLGLKPRRTVRAVLFVNEENGLKGASEYARAHAHEANLTSFAIESDEGTFTPMGISFTGSTEARRVLEDLGKQLLSSIGSGNVTGEGYGADVSFLAEEQGIPAASLLVLDPRLGDHANNPCRGFGDGVSGDTDFLKSAYFWYHHTDADTVDKLDPQQLQHCAATLAVWTYSIANLANLLPRPGPNV